MRSSGLPSIFLASRWYIRGVTATSSGTSILRAGAPAALGVAAVAPGLDALDRKRPEAERIAEAGGELFKLDHAARVGLLMNAVERRDAEVLKPGGDALVGGEHEFLDEAVGPGALGAGDAAHLAVLVELDDRLGQVEVDAAALLATPVHQHGELPHELEIGGELGILRTRLLVALEDEMDFGVGHARGRADDALDDLKGLEVSGKPWSASSSR